MRKSLCLILSFILCIGLFGCGEAASDQPKKKAVKRGKVESSELQFTGPVPGDPIAIFDTSMGEIRVVLYPDEAPMAVANFRGLCEQGYYNNTVFHRSVYGFVVQGGDASGTGLKGSTIWDNPYPAEFSTKLRHYAGALCAANSPDDPLSTASQFYFVQAIPDKFEEETRTQLSQAGLSDSVLDTYEAAGGLPYLDYTDTVFGQVYEGLSVVDEIARTDTDENDRPLEDVVLNSVTLSTYEDTSD